MKKEARMQFPRIFVQEDLPEGYDGSVRVLANLTSKELIVWYSAHLGTPGCADCNESGRCEVCTTAREAFGTSIVLIYGPKLLGEDVSTPDTALALFDRDDWPAELVAWLFVLPDSIRLRRTELIRKNARSSSGVTDNS